MIEERAVHTMTRLTYHELSTRLGNGCNYSPNPGARKKISCVGEGTPKGDYSGRKNFERGIGPKNEWNFDSIIKKQ